MRVCTKPSFPPGRESNQIGDGCPTDVLRHDCKKRENLGYYFEIATISLCNAIKTEQQLFRYNNATNHKEGVYMKFFIDTANVDEIRKAHELGVIDGVTTNPSLMAKEGKDPVQILKEICSVVDGPVSAEVVGLTADEMVKEARALAKIHKNRTNVTLVFSSTQALIAAKAGAAYVSPFVGRLDDISHVGMDLIGDIIQIYENYLFATEVIVASIRNPLHVVEAAKMGAHISTIPYSVITQLIKHPLTDVGLARFLKDWERVPKKAAGKGKK
jgi:transaldolase